METEKKKSYYELNKTKRKEYAKNYYQLHKTELRKQMLVYRKKNHPKYLAYSRKYYKDNKLAIAAQRKAERVAEKEAKLTE